MRLILSFLFGLCLILLLLVIMQWRHLQTLKKAKSVKDDITQKNTRTELIDGLNTLLLCVIQEQVELSEAVLRIKVHLDHLYPLEEQRSRFKIFYSLYDRFQEFDTHQARKNLTAQERYDQDKRRLKIEDESREEVMALAKNLYPMS